MKIVLVNTRSGSKQPSCWEWTPYRMRLAFTKPVHASTARIGPPCANHGPFATKASRCHVDSTLWVTPPNLLLSHNIDRTCADQGSVTGVNCVGGRYLCWMLAVSLHSILLVVFKNDNFWKLGTLLTGNSPQDSRASVSFLDFGLPVWQFASKSSRFASVPKQLVATCMALTTYLG